MSIWRDIPIALTPEHVIEAQYHRRPKPATVSGRLVKAATQAVELGLPLVAPAAVYDQIPVQGVAGEQVLVYTAPPGREKLALAVGPRTDLLAPAERVLVAVLTIGPALEARVRQLNAASETLLAYMLDSVGVLALGQVGEAVRRRAETQAAALGWGVGPALGPGSLAGWPLQGQRELCALLPLHEIGVRLNAHAVLEPHKSVSVVIGLGPGYESGRVGSVCRYCALADTCWRRREDVARLGSGPAHDGRPVV